MYACPECYTQVHVRPGTPEGRCKPCLDAARLSATLKRAERLDQGPVERDDRRNSKGGRYGQARTGAEASEAA